MNTPKTNRFPKAAAFMGILMLHMLTAAVAPAQSSRKFYENFGVRASATISGNRFGAIYDGSVFYSQNAHTFSLGVTAQKKNFKLSGVQLNYEYTMMDGSKHYGSKIDRLQLYAFGTVTYHNNVFLGKSACEEEQSGSGDAERRPVDMSGVKLKAVDAYAGFGMRIAFLQNFKWHNSIGIGGYNVLNAPAGLYYNSRSMGLMVRTGISYQFGNRTKTNF